MGTLLFHGQMYTLEIELGDFLEQDAEAILHDLRQNLSHTDLKQIVIIGTGVETLAVNEVFRGLQMICQEIVSPRFFARNFWIQIVRLYADYERLCIAIRCLIFPRNQQQLLRICKSRLDKIFHIPNEVNGMTMWQRFAIQTHIKRGYIMSLHHDNYTSYDRLYIAIQDHAQPLTDNADMTELTQYWDSMFGVVPIPDVDPAGAEGEPHHNDFPVEPETEQEVPDFEQALAQFNDDDNHVPPNPQPLQNVPELLATRPEAMKYATRQILARGHPGLVEQFDTGNLLANSEELRPWMQREVLIKCRQIRYTHDFAKIATESMWPIFDQPLPAPAPQV